MGSEIVQRQRVVRQRWGKYARVAEGEVGGAKIFLLDQNGVTWRKRPKLEKFFINRQMSSLET